MVLDGLDAEVESHSNLWIVDPRAICHKISDSLGGRHPRIDRPPAIAPPAIAREMSAFGALGYIAAGAGFEGLERQGCHAMHRGNKNPGAGVPPWRRRDASGRQRDRRRKRDRRRHAPPRTARQIMKSPPNASTRSRISVIPPPAAARTRAASPPPSSSTVSECSRLLGDPCDANTHLGGRAVPDGFGQALFRNAIYIRGDVIRYAAKMRRENRGASWCEQRRGHSSQRPIAPSWPRGRVPRRSDCAAARAFRAG
jgi:hypothetical protein